MKTSYIFVTILLMASILVAGCAQSYTCAPTPSPSPYLSTWDQGQVGSVVGANVEPARYNFTADHVICYTWTNAISCIKAGDTP